MQIQLLRRECFFLPPLVESSVFIVKFSLRKPFSVSKNWIFLTLIFAVKFSKRRHYGFRDVIRLPHRPLSLGGHVDSQESKKLWFCAASLAQTRIQCEANRPKTKLFILLRLNMAAEWQRSIMIVTKRTSASRQWRQSNDVIKSKMVAYRWFASNPWRSKRQWRGGHVGWQNKTFCQPTWLPHHCLLDLQGLVANQE